MENYLNERQVAEITLRKLPTLRKDRLCGRGIAFLRVGKQIRYAESDVYKFMDACKVLVRPLCSCEVNE